MVMGSLKDQIPYCSKRVLLKHQIEPLSYFEPYTIPCADEFSVLYYSSTGQIASLNAI